MTFSTETQGHNVLGSSQTSVSHSAHPEVTLDTNFVNCTHVPQNIPLNSQWTWVNSVSWSDVLGSTHNTIHQIPQRLTGAFEHSLHKVFSTSSGVGFETRFKLFMMVPHMLLKPCGNRDRTLISQVSYRLRKFDRGEWEELYADSNIPSNVPQNSTQTPDQCINRLKYLIAEGELGKAYHTISEPTQRPMNIDDQVADKLKSLFPERSEMESNMWRTYDDHVTNNINVTDNQPNANHYDNQLDIDDSTLLEAISKSNKSSGPGPSGWRLSHYAIFAQRQSAWFFDIWRHILRHDVPSNARQYYYGGRLIALSKPNSGEPRPIVATESLNKITEKAIFLKYRNIFVELLQPMQIGVGTSGGGQTLVHVIDTVLRDHPQYAVCNLDIKNAFNTIFRSTILIELQKNIPEVVSYFRNAYGNLSEIVFKHHMTGEHEHIDCHTGVRQGASLSSALFSLAYHTLLTKIKQSHSDIIIMAEQDDVYFIGRPDSILSACRTFELESAHIGLTLNRSKSKLFTNQVHPADVHSDFYEDFKVSHVGMVVSGTPIGNDNFINQWMIDHLQRKSETLERLFQSVPHIQSQLLLLRYCAVPASMHLFRTLPPRISLSYAKAHDKLIRTSLNKILFNDPQHQMDDHAWTQATLPISLGGLGLTSMERLCNVMYVSSWIEAVPIARKVGTFYQPILINPNWYTQHLFNQTSIACASRLKVISQITSSANGDDTHSMLPTSITDLHKSPYPYVKLQQTLSRRINDNVLEHLKNNVIGLENQVRINSASSLGALDFLKCLPSDRHVTINNSVFQIRLCRILGVAPNMTMPPKCLCGFIPTDTQTTKHYVNCEKKRIWTHDVVKHEVRNMLVSGGIHVEVEKSGMDIFPGVCVNNSLRVDLFSHSVVDSQTVVGDVTIRKPYSPSPISGLNNDAISSAIANKRSKYQTLCDNAHHKLEIYVFDHYGRMSPDLFTALTRSSESYKILKPAGAVPDPLKWTGPSFKSYWRQRLSCRLHWALGVSELVMIQASQRGMLGTGGAQDSDGLSRIFSNRYM